MATIDQVRKEFNVMFEEEYAKGVSMCDAYHEAERKFSGKYNHLAYSNFQSFNAARFNRAKRELKK
jgi:hypothetical protein